MRQPAAMAKKPLLIMAAGGTGGHMFPAQALSEEMLRRGWRVKLSTDERGNRYTGGYSHSVAVEVIDAATFARGGLLSKLAVPMRIMRGVLQARRAMRADPPSAVIGFGGYPSLPAMLAAEMLRIPRILHEQNGVMGRVNDLLSKRVGLVACGTWPTKLPEGVEGVDIGNPVRKLVREQVGISYPSLSSGPLEILVIGGSQGAKILSDTVPSAIAQLPKTTRARLRVSQQARDEDIAHCEELYAAARVKCEVSAFFKDVPERMARAHLIISRSGASSMADITAIGRPAILIPFAAAAGNHQVANAKGLVEAGGARMIQEADLTPDRLAQEIVAILGHATTAKKMAGQSVLRGRPNAAERLADLVEARAKGV